MAEGEYYGVLICFQRGQTMRLNFSDQGRAVVAYEKARAKDRGQDDFEIEIADDYGMKVMLDRDQVVFVCYEDPAKMVEGEMARGILIARAQAKANARIANDPVIKFAGGSGLRA